MNHRVSKRIVLFALAGLLFTVFASMLANSEGFKQSPYISPANPVTNDSLSCSWQGISNSTTYLANITWYKNSVYFASETDIVCTNNTVCTSPNGISGAEVLRGDRWNCSVVIFEDGNYMNRSNRVNVSNANPRIFKVGNQTVFEDDPFALTMTATDPEGDSIRWFSIDNNNSANPLFTININTGLISFTPLYTNVGVYIMDIIALDTHEGSDVVRMFFTIIEVDDIPVFDALPDTLIYEGDVLNYTISASDEENDNLSFNISCATLSNISLQYATNVSRWIVFNHTDFRAAYSDVGNHTVNVVVWQTNNGTQKAAGSFSLEIRSVNHIPVLSHIPNQTWVQNQTANFTLDVSAEDIDPTDELTFSITTNCTIPNPWHIVTNNNSNNATGYINLTLNNDHVVCPFVTITVTDGQLSDSQVVFFNITNSNDPPEIHEISNFGVNNAGANVSNLTGYYGVSFKYRVNATDIDMLTYEGDTLTYSTNDTLFPINSASGLIDIETNDSLIGNHTVLVTVTDLGFATDSRELKIWIKNNTIPVLYSIAPISCAEKIPCVRYINAYDPDPGENLSFGSNNTILFFLRYHNETAALLNFTPTQSQVGNHSIFVNVTDQHGAKDNQSFIFQINNTNDIPFFDMDRDNISDNITLGYMVRGIPYLYIINVTDYDLVLGDFLTFNITWLLGSAVFELEPRGIDSAVINFTPGIHDVGNYSVNISVNDSEGAYDWQVVNFTVYNISLPPNISRIRPYFNSSLGRTIYDYVNASIFPSRIAPINFSENTTVLFNASAYDPDGGFEDMVFYWYRNGVLNKSVSAPLNAGYSIYFGFFDAGVQNMTLIVEDAFFSSDSFTWIATIANVNRQPLLLKNPINLTGANEINATTQLDNYFGYYDGEQRFLDPDDDLNGNMEIRDSVNDPGESFSLTVNSTYCEVATLAFSGARLTVTPLLIGTCYVNFTATDSEGLFVKSKPVRIDVTDVPMTGELPVPIPISTYSGGGTTTITRRILIPQEVDRDVPKPIELVVPGRVIMYENQTMRIPIYLKNTWNGSLFGINLEAITNNSAVEMEFTLDFISELEKDGFAQSILIVKNYREQGPYEIQVMARVAEPNFVDTGTIFVNSLEQSGSGNQVEVKISFAKDLLTSNSECQELNELLIKAEIANRNNNLDQARNIVDSVINGCKYMINEANRNKHLDSPTETTNLLLFRVKKDYLQYSLLGVGMLILIFLIILIFVKKQEIQELRKLD